ncbi:HD domain-containing protein [Rubricoccus marinus]|uniref:HD family phosphohydrolase n=1 Tax=Rubricoccus marinus TaxID=716817 RepID=A0A259TZT5_9BACT|nr:HD domain-containing protein [Rubricoccus marinus]OZC03074.1 HD family phosphohydrolase [Rubricoccus marinus]
MTPRFKLFNDPVHGFVSVPKGLVLDLVETPEFQRLRRIRQLGLGFLVFPGAVHTRFEHGLGAMSLMYEALSTIQGKGTVLTTDEVEGALVAALLHDVGHGPFSHTLETQLIPPGASGQRFRHEAMSRAILGRIDRRLGGALTTALAIFDGRYERPFFQALLASQLDMDRLDYLRRDSFYTGVAEGVVGVERILKTLRVHGRGADAQLVIEAKGGYAVENALLSRRLMYWQVYLHKTVLAADSVLRGAFARARARWASGDPALEATTPALATFMSGEITADHFADPDAVAPEVLDAFCELDDTDVLASLKQWKRSDDRVLADLSRRFLDRDLFRTTFMNAPASGAEQDAWRERVADWLVARGLSSPADAADDASYYLVTASSRNSAYESAGEPISILERDGSLRELSLASDSGAVDAMTTPVIKPYVVAPKALDLISSPA